MTIDSPHASDPPWSVGDAISFSATATDLQDGPLPASAYDWTLTMQHCPSDCHSHIIETFSGVKSGTFEAPDHEYPSHLLLSVDVTDSGGLTAHKEVELFPATGTVAASTSPAGIPITVGIGDRGAAAGRHRDRQVERSASRHRRRRWSGRARYAFDHWSDGGARTHGVTIAPGATSVVATYKLTGGGPDRSNSCATSPAPVIPSGDLAARPVRERRRRRLVPLQADLHDPGPARSWATSPPAAG